jgi:hypothetical protein
MWPQKLLIVVLLAVFQFSMVSKASVNRTPLPSKEAISYSLGNAINLDALANDSLVWVEMDEEVFLKLAQNNLLLGCVGTKAKANGPWVYFANKYLVLPFLLGTIASINLLFSNDGYTLTTTLPMLQAGRNLANTGTGLEKFGNTYASTYAAEIAKFACISGIIQYWMIPKIERLSLPLLELVVGTLAGRTIAVAFVLNNEGRRSLRLIERYVQVNQL